MKVSDRCDARPRCNFCYEVATHTEGRQSFIGGVCAGLILAVLIQAMWELAIGPIILWEEYPSVWDVLLLSAALLVLTLGYHGYDYECRYVSVAASEMSADWGEATPVSLEGDIELWTQSLKTFCDTLDIKTRNPGWTSDCEGSPLGHCLYNIEFDPTMENCLFCALPREQK